jgi:hypothetical protein
VYFTLGGALAAGKLAVALAAGWLVPSDAGVVASALGAGEALLGFFGDGETRVGFAVVCAALGAAVLGMAVAGGARLGGAALGVSAPSSGSTTGASVVGVAAAALRAPSSALAGAPEAGASLPLVT